MTSSTAPPAAPGVTHRVLAAGTPEELHLTGQRLGFGTSRRDQHTHPPGRPAARGEKCSACRWLEVHLYRRLTPGPARDLTPVTGEPTTVTPVAADYVVHTVGGTSVPGERTFHRVVATSSAYELLELLTVRKHDREPYVAAQALRALAQAAQLDDDVRDAYVNRALV